MLARTPNFARRGLDGLAQIGPSKFDLRGIRFITDDQGNEIGDPAFPANTPVKEMTPEQRAAYWQDKARKHEDRVKAFGGKTPEEIAQLQADLDAARAASQTAEEKAIQDAKQEGRSEVISILANERVTTAIERALQGREVDPATLLTLDRSQFIDGDKADTAKITAWVTENTKEKPKGGGANLARFQGQHEQIETTGRATGEAEAERRFGPKK
jgi:class 3 adenylate cyclase